MSESKKYISKEEKTAILEKQEYKCANSVPDYECLLWKVNNGYFDDAGYQFDYSNMSVDTQMSVSIINPIISSSLLFSNNIKKLKTNTSNNIFSNISFGNPQTTSSTFGNPQTTSSIFGNPQTTSSTFGKPQTTSNIFGNPQTTSSIFGNSQTTSNIFGNPQTTSNIFGNPQTTFGNPQTTSNNIQALCPNCHAVKSKRNIILSKISIDNNEMDISPSPIHNQSRKKLKKTN